ncbi:unnamed protein product [Owenia fusiformis]|uniref:Uncharacterized protein n=1 Tax=Owenia fusiformis TaxID=6347 RepID=A0A8J1XM86_OWEFU|nr:unnamed protein product [Owenia fusiformis]
MASSVDHEEECRSRLLVSFSLVTSAPVIAVLREYTILQLSEKLKAYHPPLEQRSGEDIVEILTKEGYDKNKMKIGRVNLGEMIKESGFQFDAFTFAKLFVNLTDIDKKQFVSFDDITDPKVYLDLLTEVPNLPINDKASKVRIIRNRCGHNEFLKCDEEATEKLVELLKEITMKTKPTKTEQDPIIKEIEKWEKRMTRFTNENLDTLDDILELQEVVNPWLHIAIDDPKMKQLVDTIMQSLCMY